MRRLRIEPQGGHLRSPASACDQLRLTRLLSVGRSFSKFFLANRRARLFLFSYMVSLHLLVSGAMFWASHHEHCT